MQIYVYNQNVQLIDVITQYNSVIWAQRYNKVGDCEIYLAATDENIQKLRVGYYLGRPDDNMTCRIEKIEVKTDAENGNYLTVTGKDVKGLLHQRILWGTFSTAGQRVHTFLRNLVQSQIIIARNADRRMRKPNGDTLIQLGADYGLTDWDYQQFSYANLGQVIESYCDIYGYGYRLYRDAGAFKFEVWKGADRSASVIFSYEMDNLVGSDYIDDHSDIMNVAVVGGEGSGASKKVNSFGSASGTARHEIYVDKSSMSSEITYAELTDAYPNGYVNGSYYYARDLYILIMDNAQRVWLATNYPSGQEVTVDGQIYYYLASVAIAKLPNTSPTDKDKVNMTALLYYIYLQNAGIDELAKHGETVTFNATILPNVTYTYREDYFLGDIVTVRDAFGNEAQARISEIVEVEDANGYSVEPKFEYTSFSAAPQLSESLITENDIPLITENDEELITEGS